jgi:hypothetical protein
MAGPQPTFMQRRLARKAGGTELSRLAKNYQDQIEGLTSEYETKFSEYQKMAADKMAPFEQAVTQYDKKLSAYQGQVASFNDAFAGYSTRLSQFNQKAQNYASNPTAFNVRVGDASYIDPATGQKLYGKVNLDTGEYIYSYLKKQGIDIPSGAGYYDIGTALTDKKKSEVVYKFELPFTEKFTEQAPTAPSAFTEAAPVAPVIEKFDESPFTAKRSQLQSDMTREVAERKASRLNVAQRGRGRSLLQGAQP